jgi:subtilisin family serine protease
MTEAIEVVKLTRLMELGSGIPDVVVGLIDGPVATDHPDLTQAVWRKIGSESETHCSKEQSFACQHGTFVAGILAANRGSAAPAICPGCTFLVRPVFFATSTHKAPASATPDELARAIWDCVRAGARILNISAAIVRQEANVEGALGEALKLTAHKGVLVISAAGNQSSLGGTVITRNPWVIPVAACDWRGRPLTESNLGRSIGRHGLLAPGNSIRSVSADGGHTTGGGTSAAAPFVSGTIALLWSLFPHTAAPRLKRAITQDASETRKSVVPPLLDAWACYQALAGGSTR